MGARQSIRRAGQRVLQFGRYVESSALSAGRRPMRLLVCSDEGAYTSEQQLQPLLDHRVALRRQRLVFLQTGIGALLGWPRSLLGHFDVVAVKLSFRSSAETVRAVVAALEGLHGTCRRVYFDGDDDLCVQWPEMAGAVDAYAKKHVFADPAAYRREYVGKSNLTDYVHRVHGISFDADSIPRTRALTAEQASRICLSWNLAQDQKIRDLWRRFETLPDSQRSVDIMCRASSPPDSWIHPLRQPVVERLRGLEGRRPVKLPTERVDQQRYYEEMLTSRVCVSPFGYGEICWRDFEAIACGCLLVKPDMSHVRTAPDVFVPGETYVPVRWDLADLAETCEHYLARPEELERIVAGARRALGGWYERASVVERILEIAHGV